MKKPPVIAIVGPTATGKSQLGIELCKLLNGEVISADSMQIYKKMNIATAKPTADEMQNIPHHLADLIEPTESFNVVQYCVIAKKCIKDIHNRGKLPVIVGGTGLYINSLLNNIEFPEVKADYALRERLMKLAQTRGAEFLLEELMEIDAETAVNLHPKDVGRIIRALELFYATGIKMSHHVYISRLKPSEFDELIIGLNYKNRQLLYDRINSRIDLMIEKGLIEEASLFFQTYKSGTAQQAIGYKELFPYLEGSMELSEAVGKLKQETRRYSKRQITWFKKNEKINWIYIDEYKNQSNITAKALELILESGIVGR